MIAYLTSPGACPEAPKLGKGRVREARRIPSWSSALLARYSEAKSLERILNKILSPDRVRTRPERADTPSNVPVLALRFPAAGLLYILPNSRRTPASGKVSRKSTQWGEDSMYWSV